MRWTDTTRPALSSVTRPVIGPNRIGLFADPFATGLPIVAALDFAGGRFAFGSTRLSNPQDVIDNATPGARSYIAAAGDLAMAAANVSRVADYSSGSRAGLFEAAATNIIPSTSFEDWVNFSSTFSEVDNGFSRITSTGSNNYPNVSIEIVADTAGDHTFTVNGRPGNTDAMIIRLYGTNFDGSGANTNTKQLVFSTQTVSGLGLNSGTADVKILPDGSFSFSMTTYADTLTRAQVYVVFNDATPGKYIDLRRPQVEAGTATTSHIPTAGAPVTRPADDATVDLSGSDLSAGYTIYFRGAVNDWPASFSRVFELSDGDVNNRQTLLYHGPWEWLTYEIRAANVSQLSGGALSEIITRGDEISFAMTVGPDHCQHAYNGVAGALDTAVDFVTPDTLYVAQQTGGGSNSNTSPAQIIVYEGIATQAQLEAMTA